MSHKGPMATIAKACGEPIYEPDGLIRPAEKKSTSVRGHEPAVELGDHLSAARSSEHHFGHVTLHGHGGRTSIQGQHFQKGRTLTCINASCARSTSSEGINVHVATPKKVQKIHTFVFTSVLYAQEYQSILDAPSGTF